MDAERKTPDRIFLSGVFVMQNTVAKPDAGPDIGLLRSRHI